MKIKNKVIIITGAGSGLGKAVALKVLQNGAKVVGCGLDIKKIKAVSDSENYLGIKADVTKPADLEKLSDTALKKFGRIDVWINNAGVWHPHGPFEKIDFKFFQKEINVNLFGTYHGCQVALKYFNKKKTGMIVNIVSTSALTGRPYSSSYCASKYAQNGLTLSLMEEVSGKIKVIAVYPGGMKTELFKNKMPKHYKDYMDVETVAKKIVRNIEKEKPVQRQIIRIKKY